MVKIGASLLAADYMHLGNELERAKQANVDFLHVDVMDGHLVNDIAFGVNNVEAICANTDLCVDTHLMIAQPHRFVQRILLAGAKIVTLQFESCLDLYKTIYEIKEAKARAVICIRPATPVWMLEEAAQMADGILLVAVPLGIGGQKIIPTMYEKIRKLSEWKTEKGYTFEIGVDGGVTAENASQIKACGADCLICGTTVFASKDMKQTVNALKADE